MYVGAWYLNDWHADLCVCTEGFPIERILSVDMLEVLTPNLSLNRTARRRRLRAVRSRPVSLVR